VCARARRYSCIYCACVCAYVCVCTFDDGFRRATIIFPSIISALLRTLYIYINTWVRIPCAFVYYIYIYIPYNIKVFFSLHYFFIILVVCVRVRCMEMAIIWRLPLNETGRLGHHDIHTRGARRARAHRVSPSRRYTTTRDSEAPAPSERTRYLLGTSTAVVGVSSDAATCRSVVKLF